MSKTTAPGKGLQLMCLEGEAYSFSCHHWCMRRSLGCVQYVYRHSTVWLEILVVQTIVFFASKRER